MVRVLCVVNDCRHNDHKTNGILIIIFQSGKDLVRYVRQKDFVTIRLPNCYPTFRSDCCFVPRRRHILHFCLHFNLGRYCFWSLSSFHQSRNSQKINLSHSLTSVDIRSHLLISQLLCSWSTPPL